MFLFDILLTDMQAYEAVRWAIDRLNKKNEELNGEFLNNSYIPGITLGKYNLSWERDWLLFNTNSAIFQLYHGKIKLIFNKMMMSALY